MAHGGDHQSPGQLRGRIEDAGIEGVGKVGMGYDYSVFGRCPHIQVRQGHPDDGNELEIGQPLEQAAWQTHPFANRAKNIKWLKH